MSAETRNSNNYTPPSVIGVQPPPQAYCSTFVCGLILYLLFIIMENIVSISCICSSIVRGRWDSTRKCYNYTCIMTPKCDADDVFSESDLFESDFKIPVRDLALRTAENAVLANRATDVGTPDDLATWDKLVEGRFVGKTTIIDTICLPVKELSDGRCTSYIVEVGDTKNEVSVRNICALHGKLDKAVGRVKNQIAKYLAKTEGEES